MRNRAFSLVEILVVLAIIGILAVAMTGGLGGGVSNRADGKGKTVMGSAMMRAKDEVCRSNLNQVRQMVYVQSTGGEDGYPSDMNGIRQLPKEFHGCPIGKEPYTYDSTTGEVHCVHPGHEKY